MNANLTLTRGLIWLDDAHYNGDKILDPTRSSQREHLQWDNVAFDGPFTYRDFAYDAPDNDQAAHNDAFDLGKHAAANALTTWNVPGIPANPNPTAVRVLFRLIPAAASIRRP